MTAGEVVRRWAWSGLVLALFAGALGVLGWTWTTMQGSSAAFADTEEFAGNHLGAGTVDIAVGAGTVGFAAVNMAAGDAATGRLEIVNGGTLPLRFGLSASAPDGPLRGVLELIAWRGTSTCASEPPASVVTWRPLADTALQTGATTSGSPTSGRLAPGESVLVCMSGSLPLSASSSVQGRRLDLLLTVDAVHDIDASGAPDENGVVPTVGGVG